MKFTVTCIAAALTAAAIALAPAAMAAPSPATTAGSSAAAPTDPDRGSAVVHEPGRHPKRMPVTWKRPDL